MDISVIQSGRFSEDEKDHDYGRWLELQFSAEATDTLLAIIAKAEK